MTLSSGHSKTRLMRRFASLGPYLRENQCEDARFFFDCLAVCTNVNPAPEKREFWGWWLNLEAQGQQLLYVYRFGLFDKAGHWREEKIKDASAHQQVQTTQRNFHQRLQKLVQEFDPPLSLLERP